jgi:[acyl-carrier-protein] S-malonyltransferase
MREPDLQVVANISARPLLGVDEIRDELAGQLTWPVRWTASMQWMADQGVTRFVEIGPGEVLSKLMRRIDSGVRATSVGDVSSVEALSA